MLLFYAHLHTHTYIYSHIVFTSDSESVEKKVNTIVDGYYVPVYTDTDTTGVLFICLHTLLFLCFSFFRIFSPLTYMNMLREEEEKIAELQHENESKKK